MRNVIARPFAQQRDELTTGGISSMHIPKVGDITEHGGKRFRVGSVVTEGDTTTIDHYEIPGDESEEEDDDGTMPRVERAVRYGNRSARRWLGFA